jgi:hypothetical protein
MSIVKTYSLRIATLLAALLISVSVTAQEYRYEAGIGGGISGYLGDVNQSNVLKHPGFAWNALFRYLINKRFAVKADFTVASISGNSDDFANKFPDNAHYEFSHTYFDLGVAFEFNFLNFGMNDDYRKLKRISPYLSLGLGATYSTSKNFVPNIPISFGAKYKINRRLNLALEMRARMMLGDGVDGLKDLYGVESGVLKNNDWCPTLMLSISYEFGEICKICHYVK